MVAMQPHVCRLRFRVRFGAGFVRKSLGTANPFRLCRTTPRNTRPMHPTPCAQKSAKVWARFGVRAPPWVRVTRFRARVRPCLYIYYPRYTYNSPNFAGQSDDSAMSWSISLGSCLRIARRFLRSSIFARSYAYFGSVEPRLANIIAFSRRTLSMIERQLEQLWYPIGLCI